MRVVLSGLLLCGSIWAAAPSIAPRRPAVPTANGGACANPIDCFVDAYFQKHSTEWPQIVSDAAFARRAYLDVWGLLPTPAQLDAFLSDKAPEKRERLVHDLLANRRNYAEHWVTFWNDLLRNDEGVVYHGTRESITPWL